MFYQAFHFHTVTPLLRHSFQMMMKTFSSLGQFQGLESEVIFKMCEWMGLISFTLNRKGTHALKVKHYDVFQP